MNDCKLNAKECEILAAAYLSANKTVQSLAKELRMKPHSVNYVLHKLREEAVITPQPFINTYALGYYQAEFYASLGVAGKITQEKFEKTLISSQNVPWVGRYGGAYQYGFTVCVNSFDDLLSGVPNLLAGVSDLIRDRAFSIRSNYVEYCFKNLSKKRHGPLFRRFGLATSHAEIDELDHQILKTLCRQPHLSRNLAAEKIGIQPSTFHYRITSLEKRGIIDGYTYVVDFSKLGFLTYLYLIRLRSAEEKVLAAIRQFAENDPNVIYLSESMGGWDVKIAANVREAEDSSHIPRILAERFGAHIHEIQTLSAFAYSKVIRYPFTTLPKRFQRSEK